jgi:class 3 adenylate cyclase/tetratricopeptide (TPR) repeat protein
MFCDIVSSTELAAQLGAEDYRDVVCAYQDAAAAVVDHYDGHVAQYLGDGILAYFGYPRAHDNDAELAVRAGRDILESLGKLDESVESKYGVRLEARIGIHTGNVVVGEMGGSGKKEILALGETMSIASRLEQLAEPNAVVISHETLRLAQGMFITKNLGTQSLKGVADPVRAYQVLRATGVRNRLYVDVGRLTPLVERDAELNLLLGGKDQALAGKGNAVVVTGEAGLGKSRLVQAFHERLTEEPHTLLQCQCTPYARASAFFPLLETLRRSAGLDEQLDGDEQLRRLELAAERVGLPASEVVPLIAPLLMLPLPQHYGPQEDSPALRRQKTIAAMVSWILSLSEEQLLVVVVEDLHWADFSTLEVVRALIEQSGTSRVLTCLTFRPEFEWPHPPRSEVTQIEINRLDEQQALDLVSSMTGGLQLPHEVSARIVDRAGGVPLFLEELTKTVLESELLETRDDKLVLAGDLELLAIPTTLEGSLMARLDRLSAAREVAQRSAVLGRSFSYALAAASVGFEEGVLQRGLARLIDADILHQRGEPPDSSYLFKHALLQEAAYESLLRQTRRQLHGRVVDALLERFSEQVAAAPEVVARHAEAAARLDVAVEYYERAGAHAQERTANEEAVSHFTKAIELLDGEGDSGEDRLELALQLALGASLTAVRGYAHPERREAYERARALAQQLEDPTLLGRASIGVSISECTSGAMESARSIALRVLSNASAMNDEELCLHAHSQVALPEYYQGRFSSSLEHCNRAVDLYDPARHHAAAFLIGGDTGLSAMGVSAWNLWHLGFPDQAVARARETMALAERFQDPFALGFSAMIESTIHWSRGEHRAQESSAAKCVSVGEEYGFPVWLGLGTVIRAAGQVALGDHGAMTKLTEGAAIVAQTGVQSGAPMLLAMIATAQAMTGAFQEAMSSVGLGLAVSGATGQAFQDAELHRLKGELTRRIHSKSEVAHDHAAEECFLEAVRIAREQEARSLELRSLTSLARLRLAEQRPDGGQALLEPICEWFTEGLDTADLRSARATLDSLGDGGSSEASEATLEPAQ